MAASYYDPPGRVARLSNHQGGVSFSPDGGDRWYNLSRNRPLIRGDQVWTDRNSRAELQIGSTMLRLDEQTNVEFLELDDRLVQVQVSEGSVNLRVRRMYPGQSIEVDTPNLAFVITQPGRYRIDVDYRDDATTLVAWQGSGMVYGTRGRFPVRSGDTVRFWGEDLRDYELYGLPRADSFDRYCVERDRRLDRSPSLRYLGEDLIGYSDLDDYGRWNNDPRYGSVWYPDQVDTDWAPYRDGEWIWQVGYDWTWVDDEPWGFAPSHYGRWAYIAGRWGWIPGPRSHRPVYAPALVVFIGGSGFGLSIGWFPLGPRDVYMPSYPVSQNYFTQVNVSNTVVNNTTIINNYNIYNSPDSRPQQASFANRTVANAVTVVPRDVFVNSRPVRPAIQSADRNLVDRGPVNRAPPVGPAAPAARAPRAVASIRPPKELRDRPVFVRNTPPAIARPSVDQPAQRPTPGQERRRNIRVIPAQANAVDARAAGPRLEPGAAPTPPGALAPLDRTVEPKARRPRPAENVTPPASSVPPTPPRVVPAEREAQAANQQAQQEARAAREQAQRDAQAQHEAQREAKGARSQGNQQGNQPPPAEATPPSENAPGRCVTPAQVERMKKRGMTDQQIAEFPPCPGGPPPEEPVPQS